VPRLLARLVIDYFACAMRLALAWPRQLDVRLHQRYCAYAVHPGAPSRRDFSSVGRTGSRYAPGHSTSRLDYSVRRHSTCCPVALALLQLRCASRLFVSRQHRLYFEYAARRRDIIFRQNGSHAPQQLVGTNFV
jgi:hypothetical protein